MSVKFNDELYFHGEPCIRCSSTIRYKKTKRCVDCNLKYKKKYREDKQDELNRKSREYYSANADKIKAQKKEYRKDPNVKKRMIQYRIENREMYNEHSKRWKKRNQKKVKQTSRNYYKRNREKLIEKGRKYRVENRELLKERRNKNRKILNAKSLQRYYDNWEEEKKKRRERSKLPGNKIKRRIISYRYRCRKNKNGGRFTVEEWKYLLKSTGNKCLRCGDSNSPLQMDHIIPVSKGGDNYISNIQPLCSTCNQSKGVKTVDYRPYWIYR